MRKRLSGARRVSVVLASVICLSFAVILGAQVAEDPPPQRFLAEIQAFQLLDAKNTPPPQPVLFVGSSSIRLWATARSFPESTVVNRGFGGAHISDVLHYYDHVVSTYAPATIVFYAGDNDIAAGKSPRQVLRDWKAFVERTIREFPRTKIIYLPIKPSLDRWDHWPQMEEANRMIRKQIDEHDHLFYADVATPMLAADGTPRGELLDEDQLHLNANGYALWTKVLRPYLLDDQ